MLASAGVPAISPYAALREMRKRCAATRHLARVASICVQSDIITTNETSAIKSRFVGCAGRTHSRPRDARPAPAWPAAGEI